MPRALLRRAAVFTAGQRLRVYKRRTYFLLRFDAFAGGLRAPISPGLPLKNTIYCRCAA